MLEALHTEATMTRSFALLLALLSACGPDDEVVCTTEARASVTLTVTAPDGSVIPDATGRWITSDGGSGDCEAIGDSFACGWEVAGDFTLTIQAPGYQDAERTVTVTADECHVSGQTLAVELTPEEGPVCTDVVMPSVLVTVVGSADEALTDVAVSWHAPDALTVTPCTDYDGTRWACGAEDEGEITVTAIAAGHGEKSETVIVGADECHVITEEVTLALDWLPD
jgi:hypothetical protein